MAERERRPLVSSSLRVPVSFSKGVDASAYSGVGEGGLTEILLPILVCVGCCFDTDIFAVEASGRGILSLPFFPPRSHRLLSWGPLASPDA